MQQKPLTQNLSSRSGIIAAAMGNYAPETGI
jgi:hypothetical protein